MSAETKHVHPPAQSFILGVLTELPAGMLLLEMSGPRHRWETGILADCPLPDGMRLAAGVVDTAAPVAEHERTVMSSLLAVAEVTGMDPGMILATPDCGFRTTLAQAAPSFTTRLKLQAMVSGARLAAEVTRTRGLMTGQATPASGEPKGRLASRT